MRRAAGKVLSKRKEPYSWKLFCKDILEVALFFAVILLALKLMLGADMPVPLAGVVSCSMIHEDEYLSEVSYSLARTFPAILPAPCTYNYGGEWRTWIAKKALALDTTKMPFKSGFAVGDLLVVGSFKGAGLLTKNGIVPGDVILFTYKKTPTQPGNEPLLHRVVAKIEVRNGTVANISGALDCFTPQDFRDEFVQYIKRCQKGLSLCPYGKFPPGGDYNLYLTKGDNNAITDQCSALIVPPITDENVMAKAYVRIPLLGWLKIFIEPLFNFLK
jgi:hypothetical protein